jgi:hypothetical protein
MSTVEGYYNHPNVAAQLYPNYGAAQMGYSSLGEFWGFEENLKRVFAAIPGASTAYNDLVALIQQKAKEGAEQAIPRIKSEVESTVKPYVIAALLLGLGGFLFGISTYMMNRGR